ERGRCSQGAPHRYRDRSNHYPEGKARPQSQERAGDEKEASEEVGRSQDHRSPGAELLDPFQKPREQVLYRKPQQTDGNGGAEGQKDQKAEESGFFHCYLTTTGDHGARPSIVGKRQLPGRHGQKDAGGRQRGKDRPGREKSARALNRFKDRYRAEIAFRLKGIGEQHVQVQRFGRDPVTQLDDPLKQHRQFFRARPATRRTTGCSYPGNRPRSTARTGSAAGAVWGYPCNPWSVYLSPPAWRKSGRRPR